MKSQVASYYQQTQYLAYQLSFNMTYFLITGSVLIVMLPFWMFVRTKLHSRISKYLQMAVLTNPPFIPSSPNCHLTDRFKKSTKDLHTIYFAIIRWSSGNKSGSYTAVYIEMKLVQNLIFSKNCRLAWRLTCLRYWCSLNVLLRL